MFSLTEHSHSHSQSYDGYLDELIRIRSVIRCSTTAVLAELCLLPAIESGKSDCVVSSHQRKRSRERESVFQSTPGFCGFSIEATFDWCDGSHDDDELILFRCDVCDSNLYWLCIEC